MKKFTKVTLIICLICSVLGVVFCVAGVMIGIDGDVDLIKRIDRLDIVEKTVDDFSDGESTTSSIEKEFENVKSLAVDLNYGTFRIEESDEITNVKLVIKARGQDISYEQSGDCLVITEETDYYLHHSKNAEIVLTIPSSMEFENIDIATDAGVVKTAADIIAKDVSVEVNAGTVNLEKDISAQNVTIEVDAGKVTGRALNVSKETVITVDAGNVDFDAIETNNLELETNMGNQSISSLKITGDAVVSCDMGKIDLTVSGKATDYRYHLSCDMGKVQIGSKKFSSVNIEKEINGDQIQLPSYDLECGMGNITLSFEK